MAAPVGRTIPFPASLEERPLAAVKKMAAREEFCEEVIKISDEEQERQDGFSLGDVDVALQSVGQFDGGAGVEEDGAGCDAPRFPGGLSEVTVHREAGQPSGGQSLPVKVRAPLVHRKEGRVKSRAVYPTARESVAPGSLGHGAGSVFDEQPSASRGAGARFESQDEEWLDYEEDVEEQAIPVSYFVVKEATPAVPEMVQGDRSGNRHKEMAGNLPRGEVGMGIGMSVGSAIGGLISRKGGVDVSIQVDSVAGTGAGKSEVAVDMVVGGVRKEELQDSVKSNGVVSSGGSVGDPDGVCAVWIVVHSFVRWAEKQATTRHFGRQLGLDGIRIKLGDTDDDMGDSDNDKDDPDILIWSGPVEKRRKTYFNELGESPKANINNTDTILDFSGQTMLTLLHHANSRVVSL
ncbi:hypothetical protein NDU88_001490 [Pleurodeles waltl]|uniref:Uncharacterized protein n=1 Tax=Pleurodeles waltl TaxID=8319 RepID=A0AAV7T0E9_PLEWA|nr:hypothetical protein NDU88_001490 [Pleurodeles waltl]